MQPPAACQPACSPTQSSSCWQCASSLPGPSLGRPCPFPRACAGRLLIATGWKYSTVAPCCWLEGGGAAARLQCTGSHAPLVLVNALSILTSCVEGAYTAYNGGLLLWVGVDAGLERHGRAPMRGRGGQPPPTRDEPLKNLRNQITGHAGESPFYCTVSIDVAVSPNPAFFAQRPGKYFR